MCCQESPASRPLRILNEVIRPHSVAAFGQLDQAMRVADDDALAAALDQALLLPAAEDAAHRVQRRAGHFRHVLAADGKVDLHALGDLAAALPRETQER